MEKVEPGKCVVCQVELPHPEGATSPRGVSYRNGRVFRILGQLYFSCFSCQLVSHIGCIDEWDDTNPVCPHCQEPSRAPEWHRQANHWGMVLAGLAGFVVMSHVMAAAAGLPQRVVWARERLYFGLPRQFFVAWTGSLVGFPLGAACVERLGQEWDYRTRKPTEAPKVQHPKDRVRPRWRREWNLVAGSWVAMWIGVITMQMLFGKIVASRNEIPMRNLWVLSQRARLPIALRQKMEIAVTLGNVFGVGTGLTISTVVWDGLRPAGTHGDTAAKRADRFWEVATTMAGLIIASHVFTIFIKECACTPRRQVWHGFGIAKLFKGDPTFHSRKLALATAAMAVPFAFIPAYMVWVGRD